MNATATAVLVAALLCAAAPVAAVAPARVHGVGAVVARQTTQQAVPEDSSAVVDSVPDTWTAPAPFAVPPIEPFEGTVVRRTRPWVNAAIVLLAAAIIGLAGALVYRRLAMRRYWREEADEALAPLVFNRPVRRTEETVDRPRTGSTEPRGAPPRPDPHADDVTKGMVPGYNEDAGAASGASGGAVPSIPEPEPPGIEVEAGPIRFHRPPAGTLQLLPGRLEIVSGKERQEEIRFVKLPRAAAVVTFGRVPGAAYRHIQLQSPTVSRMHAAMQFQGGRWHIENLSHTNPVIVNGRRLAVNGAAEMLSEGDQVEMGEVVFRFRAR